MSSPSSIVSFLSAQFAECCVRSLALCFPCLDALDDCRRTHRDLIDHLRLWLLSKLAAEEVCDRVVRKLGFEPRMKCAVSVRLRPVVSLRPMGDAVHDLVPAPMIALVRIDVPHAATDFSVAVARSDLELSRPELCELRDSPVFDGESVRSACSATNA